MDLLMIGAGRMSGNHAKTLLDRDDVRIAGVVDLDPERLSAFADEFGVPEVFTSVEAALDARRFDCALNATIDGAHYATCLPLIEAGVPILCEKPLTPGPDEARDLAARVTAAGIPNMVNFSYRNGWAVQEAARRVADGTLGQIRHFSAAYRQSWLVQDAWGNWATEPTWLWRLSTAHGSTGVLGDIGVHLFDLATFVLGSSLAEVSCQLTTFDKAPGGKIGDYTLDANDSAVAHGRLKSGASGVFHCTRFATGYLNDLTLEVHGTEGALQLFTTGQTCWLKAHDTAGGDPAAWTDVDPVKVPSLQDRFFAALQDGSAVQPDFARGAEIQAVLAACEQASNTGTRITP